jgi:hypothetical protein
MIQLKYDNIHLPGTSGHSAAIAAVVLACMAVLTLAPDTLASPGLQPAHQTIPTRTPEQPKPDRDEATQTPILIHTPLPITRMTGSPTPTPAVLSVRQRFGVGVPYPPIDQYDVGRLGLGWYHAWQVIEQPPDVAGVETWQMVRVTADGFLPDAGTITRTAQAHPGSTWLIGNEPDVIWQDSVTPARYAQAYHDIYYLLKQSDPTCQVAAGGVAQPTPLRLQYLDMVLQAYRDAYGEPLPADMWQVHNFMLREERGSWGVDIPPGTTVGTGILYEIKDNDNIEAFKQQIVAFRRWMSDRGQRNKPLIVSEYGIPMPEDYGFDPGQVRRFMYATFDFFLTAKDKALGCPTDDNRLVQRWAWYSMADTSYPTGNLADPETKQLTQLGKAFGDYIAGQ